MGTWFLAGAPSAKISCAPCGLYEPMDIRTYCRIGGTLVWLLRARMESA